MRKFCKGHLPGKRGSVLFLGAALCFSAGTQATPTCTDSIPGKINNRFTDHGNGTVMDSVTRLVWQRCDLSMKVKGTAECESIPASGHVTYTWKEALNEVKKFNIAEDALGRPATWRLPNIKELASLSDLHCTYSDYWSIDTATFPDADTTYWSSTPVVHVDAQFDLEKRQNGAWAMDFLKGKEEQRAVGNATSVRLVR